MKGNEYQEVMSLRLGMGDLVVLQDKEEQPSRRPYDDHPEDHSPVLSERVVYVTDQDSSPIPSLNSLIGLTRAIGLHLPTELKGKEGSFAMVVSCLLDVGRVITPTRRYSWMEDEYGIDLDRYRPRIEGDTLHFICKQLGWENIRAPLVEVCLNLTTAEHETQVVATWRDSQPQ